MRPFKHIAGLMCSAVLSACVSAPTHFYTLLSPAAKPEASRRAEFAIEVQQLSVPSQVDQPQMVIRRNDGQLNIAEHHLWIAPLADEIRAALSAELSARLGAIDVYRMPRNSGQDVFRVRTKVQRFESLLGKGVELDVVWAVEPSEREAQGLTCSSRFRVQAEADYLSLATAHQKALSQLAAQLARVIERLANHSDAVACPAS